MYFFSRETNFRFFSRFISHPRKFVHAKKKIVMRVPQIGGLWTFSLLLLDYGTAVLLQAAVNGHLPDPAGPLSADIPPPVIRQANESKVRSVKKNYYQLQHGIFLHMM